MLLFLTLLIPIFMESYSEHKGLQVVGPKDPVVALTGEDLILPCSLKPNTSAVDMTVEWLRLKEVASLVHLYKDHEDRNEDQAQPYRGRTAMFKEELSNGNTSLKLSGLQISDEGKYKCLIEEKFWFDDITVQVIVEALGSHPEITMESYDHSGGINLVCASRGWKPEPQVLWLDGERVTLPAEATQIHQENETFSVRRRITVHDSNDANKFYCRIQHKLYTLETEVIINRNVFDVWKWAVGISVSTCFIAVGLIISTIIQCKKASALQKQWKKEEFLKMKKFAVDVTLDPDTAHPELILSLNGKQVTHGDRRMNLPDIPQRFIFSCVLGRQGFSSGRFYYEVQVSGKIEWTLGVVTESIKRKEWIERKPQNGFWTVGLRYENQYWAYADPSVILTLREKVEKVGVFVDYEEGLVSFYNADTCSHIYSFTDQVFIEKKLYPYFSPRYRFNEGGDNSAPIVIAAVKE